MQFSHLHVHTQFSLLDGATDITKMLDKAKADNMPAVAITDHGNMFGVFKFVAEANKKGIKPIVGCEFYLVEDRHKRAFTKEQKDVRNHQLFLAKNEVGYKNLVKLCSLGFMEGLYGKYPRIDKELVLKYHEGLIATTCCIGASVPRKILRESEEAAEIEFKWWLDIFGEDYYVELQNHDIPDQLLVNEVLLRFAKKYNVPVIASNDTHYLEQADSNAHDILLCINTGEKQSTPTYKDIDDSEGGTTKGRRFGFYNDQFFFKNTQQMTQLWSHLPQAIDNTNEIVGKIEPLSLKKDILLPNFVIPAGFETQDDYLREITYEGAKKRYGEINQETQERIDFELHVVKTMGFAGYFLIVADFIKAGRDIGVFIGPGRGSAAGSAVAYCIGITNIDPIKYNLLFERFLNPDRKSMPDIDTDFDDEGRQKVIDYVVDKYGKNQVAQIVTYGTMAAKMSIKDVARVLDLPLNDSNYLAKLVPDRPGTNLNRVMNGALTGSGSITDKDKEGYNGEDLENIKKLREIRDGNDIQAAVLKEALILEGSVRNTGLHAAGIIIAPSDLTDILPVATSKETNLLITQYEGKIIEDAGVIKMDFLGLKTLSIMKEALSLIKENHGISIDPDEIPLDDPSVYELYQRAETNATFQFESAGMQKHLRDLKPDQFGDLIAMNALFRPGPMDYIPNFIARKHGREPITYDLPEMEEYLAETYGITVYQEQVMLLSQKIGGFTKGKADYLRKAMGKKDREMLDKLKPEFMGGAKAKGHPEDILNKVWTDWEAFAQYAFNKSHSTCYAFVAYQTAWLKTHYPSEYMAGVMSNSLGQIEKITFFMEECKRMGLNVLGPDVNESKRAFAVNKNGQIRFGLGAIKGTGDAAVESIIDERLANREYKDIFDFVKRVNLRTVNKKTIESLVYGGGFDCFGIPRAAFFEESEGSNFIEKLIKYANRATEDANAAQVSLFGSALMAGEMDIPTPKFPDVQEWSQMEKLKYEKDVVGIYISGHPLDAFKLELDTFCTSTIDIMMDYKNRDVAIAGIVTKSVERFSKNGKPFVIFTIEDYSGAQEIALFGQDYINFNQYIEIDRFLYMKGQIKPRWNQEDNWEFKISSIQLLAEIRNKLTKELKITIQETAINQMMVENLQDIIEANKGDISYSINITSPDIPSGLSMISRKSKIDPSNQLLEQLAQIEGIAFKLN